MEVVRTMWDAFLRRDFDKALSGFHPDVEWDGTNLPDGQISHGNQAILEHTARWADTWVAAALELRQATERLIAELESDEA